MVQNIHFYFKIHILIFNENNNIFCNVMLVYTQTDDGLYMINLYLYKSHCHRHAEESV